MSLHNLPEGVATVTPLVGAGVKRWRSVGLATVSGLVETVGAVVGVVGWGMGFAAAICPR